MSRVQFYREFVSQFARLCSLFDQLISEDWCQDRTRKLQRTEAFLWHEQTAMSRMLSVTISINQEFNEQELAL